MSIGTLNSCSRVVDLDYITRISVGSELFGNRNISLYKSRRTMQTFPLASADDGVAAVNGTPHSDDVEEMGARLSGSIQDEYNCDELVQSLHDSARSFELALLKKISSPMLPWFSSAWLGVDRNAWVKTFSYQASVYSLLQAAKEVSSRGINGDKDLNVFVQRSLSRQAAPLDSMMRDKLSSSHPEADEWFWSDQIPSAVTSFVHCFERDQRFVAATSANTNYSIESPIIWCAAAVEQQLGESAQRIEILDTTVAELNRKMDRLDERVNTIVATSQTNTQTIQASMKASDAKIDRLEASMQSLIASLQQNQHHATHAESSGPSQMHSRIQQPVQSVVTLRKKYELQYRESYHLVGSSYAKGKSSAASNETEVSLLVLVLNCIAAVTKLGPTKLLCLPFCSMIPDTTGRLMDKFVNLVPLPQAYQSMKSLGLRREFLVHFGPRAAACRVESDCSTDEVVFWVDLIQNQLLRAIDREKIWSRLATSESIEVLERDLAIFGFFIALGRSTQTFLAANGSDSLENPVEDLVRHFIGGSLLQYPQLSAISSYQLYVEVVCEELDWLPFYPNTKEPQPAKQAHGHKSRPEGTPNYDALPQIFDVCSYWLQSFIKYSKWPENPSNVKAAKFLSKGHNKLIQCKEELGRSSWAVTEAGLIDMNALSTEESSSFDKALESVDEALVRLESLLQQLNASSSASGKEEIKAACSDLEKIRKLKKEAEFLEASFRAKAASLQEGGGCGDSQESSDGKNQNLKGNDTKNSISSVDQGTSMNRGFWGFFERPIRRKSAPNLLVFNFLSYVKHILHLNTFVLDISNLVFNQVRRCCVNIFGYFCNNKQADEYIERSREKVGSVDSEPSEIYRFELLRNELMELEKRVQASTDDSVNEEGSTSGDPSTSSSSTKGVELVQSSKRERAIEKTLDKIKETSTDVWQGTQLLGSDSAAAMELLRRSVTGDELTEKEKKALRRTVTDLASVVPIGVLMILPVTPVGHAAILAAIQRYAPGLIPSTYGSERLNLLRQLEQVKQMQNETEPEKETKP
ncbi:hypothetical protein IGI04_041882 [Brassica rapa subsp. trilocularis]|uniref:Letm1 RBD domain-containing protein n=1 Tax=Brassica rapa subsp. trilocularis TaxID=1813537 RepID=A0ABQ7KW50_BRACM|nr:hypothetical protein IGI04_041882 [Brassica rapa subsp. trilocularis]